MTSTGPHRVATLPRMPSDDRVNIILPAEERALADRIAHALGAMLGGNEKATRSQAIRYSLRVAAEKLGVSEATQGKEKKRKQTP